MSDLNRSTSPSSSASLRAPKDEQILSEQVLEEDRSAGGSDGAARSKTSADAPIFAPASEPPGGIDIENEAPSSHPPQTNNPPISGPRQQARKETFFGIPQPSAAPLNVNSNYDDDYDKHLPPDPIYEEATSPNARVYRVYMAESAKYDAYMTDEAREGLDVLLVFAGLFSAVLTTFVAQTSQSLQPDRATESTLLLREIAALQRAQINGTSIDSIPSTSADFTPSSLDVWVNGLWFTSLTLSLVAALLAVLMKQWIRHYTSFVSGTAKERSLIRQYRFMGLQKWHVPTLIGILPVLLHLSLAIFFVGLTLFLVPLRRSIASIVGSLSALVFVAYIATAVWPSFHIQCPYHTPLSNIIHDITFMLCGYMFRRHWRYVSLKEQEHGAARSGDALVAHAFEWLLSMSSNPSVHRVVVQAVGGLLRKSSTDKLEHNSSFLSAWEDMLRDCIRLLWPDSPCILPEKVDLLEQLFRSALHIRQFFFWLSIPDVRTAIQSFPAPTLQWESVATALLWHYGICTDIGDFEDPALAQKACKVVGRLMSDPWHDKETRLPATVWENLLAAVSSCPSIVVVPLPDLSDPVLNKTITNELIYRVCWGREPYMYDERSAISLRDALHASENFVWFLLLPFDKHEGNALDSIKVQRLLSLVNAIVSHGLFRDSSHIFLGACKELICELQAGSVTLQDREAIYVAADTLLQGRTPFQDSFDPAAVLLPSLIFLHCWKADITSRTARNAVLLALIEIDMFKVLNRLDDIEFLLWSEGYGSHPTNNAAPVASLVTSVIRRSFELRTGPESQPEDSQWLEYLSLPENISTIVSIFTFQGTTDTPASVAQVRDNLLLFFSSQSLDCDTLQICRTSLESQLEDFVPLGLRDSYGDNMKEAKKVIDEFISKQSPKPENLLNRLLRRAGTSPDPEAIITHAG